MYMLRQSNYIGYPDMSPAVQWHYLLTICSDLRCRFQEYSGHPQRPQLGDDGGHRTKGRFELPVGPVMAVKM